VAPPAGFEPATYGLGNRSAAQILSDSEWCVGPAWVQRIEASLVAVERGEPLAGSRAIALLCDMHEAAIAQSDAAEKRERGAS
jgi:hypothetical protein